MKLRSVLLAALIASTVAVSPPRVAARPIEEAGIDGFDSTKFWDYALCGASIVFASGTGGWVMAVFICGKAFTEHWTK